MPFFSKCSCTKKSLGHPAKAQNLNIIKLGFRPHTKLTCPRGGSLNCRLRAGGSSESLKYEHRLILNVILGFQWFWARSPRASSYRCLNKCPVLRALAWPKDSRSFIGMDLLEIRDSSHRGVFLCSQTPVGLASEDFRGGAT